MSGDSVLLVLDSQGHREENAEAREALDSAGVRYKTTYVDAERRDDIPSVRLGSGAGGISYDGIGEIQTLCGEAERALGKAEDPFAKYRVADRI